MKISKYLPLSIVATFFLPIAGFVFSIAAIGKKGMNRMPFILISFFYFCFLIKIPPYGDSYRRFLDFESFTTATSALSFLSGHPDVFFYLTIVIFKSLSLPYFILPATYGAMMIYFVLCSLRNGTKIVDIEMSGKKKFISFLVILSAFDIINFALGLRFGLSIAISVYGVTTYFSGSKKKGLLAMIVAITVHFSMALVLMCFIASKFITLSKKSVIPLSIMAFLISATALPFILNQFSFLSVAQYALSGYVESGWADASTNLNTLGVFLVRNLLQFGVLVLFLLDKNKYPKIDNFLCLLIPVTFLMSLSFSAVQRYLVVCNLILLSRVLPSYYDVMFKKKMILIFFTGYIVLSGLLLDIYVQRIAIIWGQLWKSYYTSPITLLYYSDQDFKNYLKEVGADGNWVKNKQGVGG
ncbi:hypothetical protein GA565_03935 [Rouxiella sp. S1S-2]|uniref:EpsG family protein n=1 Tax=Rouxiella sp. S1S-2 TaxID=2653856 RepID=UPI001264AD0C|nr:EpsG family protein [Rouxiella sp. S1S-2]KAB7895201.1 hypothetical protein GA565_03935 [Rouxiella sp. S1S-2]